MLVVLKKTLPTSVNNELIDWPPVGTYDDALAFSRRRTDHRKKHDLSEFAKKKKKKKKILIKTRLNAMTTGQDAQMSSNETSKTWRSAGADKYKYRKATVSLANTPGIAEESIDAVLTKGKVAGRARSPGKGQGKSNGSRGNSPQPRQSSYEVEIVGAAMRRVIRGTCARSTIIS